VGCVLFTQGKWVVAWVTVAYATSVYLPVQNNILCGENVGVEAAEQVASTKILFLQAGQMSHMGDLFHLYIIRCRDLSTFFVL
jgi:hypothetical protein